MINPAFKLTIQQNLLQVNVTKLTCRYRLYKDRSPFIKVRSYVSSAFAFFLWSLPSCSSKCKHQCNVFNRVYLLVHRGVCYVIHRSHVIPPRLRTPDPPPDPATWGPPVLLPPHGDPPVFHLGTPLPPLPIAKRMTGLWLKGLLAINNFCSLCGIKWAHWLIYGVHLKV